MKIIIITSMLCLSISMLMAQPFNAEIDSDGDRPTLLGKINQEGLSAENYSEWFLKNKSEYEPKAEVIDQLKNELNDYTITLFMGTWCGDSKREVPRFYKILEAADYPLERLTSVGVARDKENYKQSPGGEDEGQNIHRVPTFIIYKNGKEVNRIVESPKNTLEEDLLQLLQGEYKSNYHVVTVANKALNEMGLEKFRKKKKKILATLKKEVQSWGELSTYSYVLFHSGQKDEAIEVARLNTLLYPDEARTFARLAGELRQTGKYEEARLNFQKALNLDPENKDYQEAVANVIGEN